MDRTRIHQGTLPAPAQQGAAPVAYERAPTLLAGESAGAQGQVRVWVPSRRNLWAMLTGGSAAFLVSLWFVVRERNPGLAWTLIMLASCVAAAAESLRRPCYITTDEAGMAVTTRHGSHALRWSEIESVELSPGGKHRTLDVYGPDRVQIVLTGYPRKAEARLIDLIVRHVGLKPERPNGYRFIREHPSIDAAGSTGRGHALAPCCSWQNPALPPAARLGLTFTEMGTPAVASVMPGSPAAQAGLQPGDEVVVMNQLKTVQRQPESEGHASAITFQITVRRRGAPGPLQFQVHV